MTINRRQFLDSLWICAAAVLTLRPGAWRARPAPHPRVSELLALFTQRHSAAVIGREYLRQNPQEAEVQILVEHIRSSQAPAISGKRLSQGSVARWLRRRQREDFRQGRTVALDGWVLSRTEARLCALLALVEEDA